MKLSLQTASAIKKLDLLGDVSRKCKKFKPFVFY